MNLFYKKIAVLLLCFSVQSIIAQSGFLGSTLSIELEVDTRVNVLDIIAKRRTKLEVDSSPNMRLISKTRPITTSYNIGVNKVINDDFQLGIKIGIIPLKIYIPTLIFKDTLPNSSISQFSKSALSNFTGQVTTFSFNVKKYSKGIAPIGKYFGLNLGGAIAKLISNQTISIGNLGTTQINFLSSSSVVNSSEEITFSKGGEIKNVFLNFTMGETIPVMQKIGINFEMSFPLLRVYMFENGAKRLGIGIKDSEDGYNFGPTDLSSNLAFALKKSQGIRFNVGVKFFL